MFLADPVLGHEAIPMQNDILLIDLILDNICWLLYKIREYCIIIESRIGVQLQRYMTLDISNLLQSENQGSSDRIKYSNTFMFYNAVIG
jgi:hypothetical protein